MKEKPTLIGIVGPSGSGKTTVGSIMKSIFNNFEHVRLDDYLKDPSTFGRKNGFVNWEEPRNFDYEKLAEHLKALSFGKSVRYVKEFGGKKHNIELKPKKYIVVEGILLLKDRNIKKLLKKKIFIDIPLELIPERRRKRNNLHFPDYDLNVVVPEYIKHGLNQKREADIIIDGTQPIDDIINAVMTILEPKLQPA